MAPMFGLNWTPMYAELLSVLCEATRIPLTSLLTHTETPSLRYRQ